MPSFWDGFWKGAQEAGVITAETAPAAPALAAPREPAQPDPRVAQLESELAALRAQQITAAAAHFAETAVRDGKALPAEQAQLAAVYTLLASDDATHPRETPRVAALTALVAQRPAHQLTTERVPSGLTVLPTNTDSSSPQAQAEAGRKQAEEYARKTNGKH